MRRREFITLFGGAAATWPIVARAQQGERMRQVGMLLSGTADDALFQTWVGAFLESLAQSGWVNGRNVRIETRWAGSKADDISRQAQELAALVDPNNATITETTIQDVQKAAPTMGLQTQIINATTVNDINEIFGTFERERPDALFVIPDPFL